MDEKDSYANEQEQGKKLRHGDDSDCARPFADTADVDEDEQAVNSEHDGDSHDRTSEKWNGQCDRIREHIHHSGDRAERSKKIKYACEKSNIPAKRDFDVSVEPTR